MSSTSGAPDNFSELLSQGAAALQAGNPQLAIAVWGEAALHTPASGAPHFLIGSALASQGEYEKAEAAFSNAVLLAPNFSIARYQLGLLQFSSGRAALALVMWQPILETPNPTLEEQALALFVRGYAALAQDDFVTALAHFREGIRINNGNAAVSDDVNMVIERVEQLLTNVNTNPNDLTDGKHAVATGETDSHVLLSNYQNSSKLH